MDTVQPSRSLWLSATSKATGSMVATDPTKTRAWRVLRDDVVEHEPICWLQFPGICTRVSTTADHIIPKSVRPDLAMVRSNLKGACLPCNKARNTTPIESLNLSRSSGAADIFGD